jgi:hypothetical protein
MNSLKLTFIEAADSVRNLLDGTETLVGKVDLAFLDMQTEVLKQFNLKELDEKSNHEFLTELKMSLSYIRPYTVISEGRRKRTIELSKASYEIANSEHSSIDAVNESFATLIASLNTLKTEMETQIKIAEILQALVSSQKNMERLQHFVRRYFTDLKALFVAILNIKMTASFDRSIGNWVNKVFEDIGLKR